MTRAYRRSTAAAAVGLAIVFAAVMKLVALHGGWAANDADKFHFVIIDYFIEHGFDWNYPQELPMYPGMHAFFAGCARLFGLGSIKPTDWSSFWLQSIWGGAYVASVLFTIWRVKALFPKTDVWQLTLILLCSSYPLFSWLWPTTELGAFAAMFVMLAIALGRSEFTWGQMAAYAVAALIGTLFRQNYATLALAPAASLVLRVPARLDRRFVGQLALTMIPIGAVGALVGFFTWKWGDLVPPELRRHGGISSIQLVQLQQLAGLVGLIGFPFALLAANALRMKPRIAVAIVLACLAIATISECVWPMTFDRMAGRWGSLVWTILQMTGPNWVGASAMIALMTVGLFTCLTALYMAVQEKTIPQELIFFGLLAAGLVVQTFSYQRYSEVAIFGLFGIFFLTRVPPAGWMKAFVWLWFGFYAVVTIARPILQTGSLAG